MSMRYDVHGAAERHADGVDAARERMMKRNADAWKQDAPSPEAQLAALQQGASDRQRSGLVSDDGSTLEMESNGIVSAAARNAARSRDAWRQPSPPIPRAPKGSNQ